MYFILSCLDSKCTYLRTTEHAYNEGLLVYDEKVGLGNPNIYIYKKQLSLMLQIAIAF